MIPLPAEDMRGRALKGSPTEHMHRKDMITTTHKKRIRLKGFDYKGCYRYSLTFCTRDKLPRFGYDGIVRNIADILGETARSHKFKIWSFCFMPDHLHVLVEGESPESDLRKFAVAFKQMSGYWFRRLRRKQASLKACPTERHEGKNAGQGFSPANKATLKGCPTKDEKGADGQSFSFANGRCADLWQINSYEHVLGSDEATEKVAR